MERMERSKIKTIHSRIRKKLLDTSFKARGLNAPKFAEEVGRTKQAVYGQLSDKKGISKDTAIKYGEILNVDPVDLLFPKKLLPFGES